MSEGSERLYPLEKVRGKSFSLSSYYPEVYHSFVFDDLKMEHKGVGRLTHWHVPFNSLHCLVHYIVALQKPVGSSYLLVCLGHVSGNEKSTPLNSKAHCGCPTHLFPKLVSVTTYN